MKKLFIVVTSGMLSLSAMSVFSGECVPQKLVCHVDKSYEKRVIFTYPDDIPKGGYDNSTCDKKGVLTEIQYGSNDRWDCITPGCVYSNEKDTVRAFGEKGKCDVCKPRDQRNRQEAHRSGQAYVKEGDKWMVQLSTYNNEMECHIKMINSKMEK